MISRKSAKLLADIFEIEFVAPTTQNMMKLGPPVILQGELDDFLYLHDYDANFMRLVTNAVNVRTPLSRFFRQIHTGESLNPITIHWDEEKIHSLSQELLRRLARDIISRFETKTRPSLIVPKPDAKPGTNDFFSTMNDNLQRPFRAVEELKNQLELDGYVYRNGNIYESESSVVSEKEEQNFLMVLVKKLPISNKDIIENHLTLSEDHYLNNRWGDSISNARNFLEECLNQAAKYIHQRENVSQKFPGSAQGVRDFLVSHSFLDQKEKETIEKMYGFISDRGSHPNIAEKDEARLMRHIALSMSQYILLKLEKTI